MSAERSPTLLDARAEGMGVSSSIEEAEHVGAVLRLRAVVGIGAILWTVSACSDVIVANQIAPGALATMLALRLAGEVVIVAGWLRLRFGARPSRRGFKAIVAASFAVPCLLLSAIGLVSTGIATLYVNGVVVVLVVYGVTVADRWTRGLVGAAAPALAYPIATGAAAAISPAIAAQFRDPFARTAFVTNCGNLAIAYAVVVLAGHMTWALRRQVFEARSLGRYKLKRRIGEGGMGEVWLAHHGAIKRDVAVKVLRAGTTDGAARARFEREVRATTELSHPNTIRIFDYGVSDDGVCYYVMELLEGESVVELAAREKALPPARAIHLVRQAARALAEAHAKGIVHRDVKPENLFVVSGGGEPDFVKVLDFGIAHVAMGEGDAKLTRPGAVVGTPAWLAPETIAGRASDARADVYALGAVLYLLLAGRAPFEASDGMPILAAHLHERPAPPSRWRGEALPGDVEAIVLRCLEKDPAARYATARELADALDACEAAGRWIGARDAPSVKRVEGAAAALAATEVGDASGTR